jgi:hypothetical protein
MDPFILRTLLLIFGEIAGNPVSHGGFVGTGQLRAAFPRCPAWQEPYSAGMLAVRRRGVRRRPSSIVTIGLPVLTLVPLGRVAFTFVLFVKERERIFALATAYVLAALIAV